MESWAATECAHNLRSAHRFAKGSDEPLHLRLRPNGDAKKVGEGRELAAYLYIALTQSGDYWLHRATHIDHQEVRVRRDPLKAQTFEFGIDELFDFRVAPLPLFHLFNVLEASQGCYECH